MIQQKELRAGNLVLVPSIDDEIYEMHTINRYGRNCSVTDNKLGVLSGVLDIENIMPIELTEDWLLKFAFDKEKRIFIDDGSLIELDKATGSNDELAYNVFIKQIDDKDKITDSIIINIELQYVHQLQNLYYALAGEELILK